MNGAHIERHAQEFLEDSFELQNGRPSKDADELIQWCLLQWSSIRALLDDSERPAAALGRMARGGADTFPGLASKKPEAD